MLTNLSSLLKSAQNEKRAVAAFNVYNTETILAVAKASKHLNKPVIFSFGEGYFDHTPIELIALSVKEIVQQYGLTSVLHLDHAKNPQSVIKAIGCGFTSVMYDGSHLEFEENLANTKVLADIAHSVGVSIEGELGYMNPEDGSQGDKDLTDYTRVDLAQKYVQISGVDALAVAVGNAHGIYKGTPFIDFVRLKEIANAVSVPLVLHGCSGIPAEMIKKAVSLGVCKINVNTELAISAVQSIEKMISTSKQPLRLEKAMAGAMSEMEKITSGYIQILS